MTEPLRTVENELLVLSVARKDAPHSPLVARHVLCRDDVLAHCDEAWLQGLRKGELPWDQAALTPRWAAVRRGGSVMLSGVIVELGANGQRVRRLFPPQCFSAALGRALEAPLARGDLKATDQIHYWLAAEPAPAATSAPAAGPGGGLQIRVCSPAWQPEAARLADYLDRSRPLCEGLAAAPRQVDKDRALHPPVFFHARAWEQGRRFAGQCQCQCQNQNLESAAVFTGRLMFDAQVPEAFLVVDACLEARHAEQERYSVLLTAESWSDIRKKMDLRRRRLGRPHEIIVGSVHGHPFLPAADEEDGSQACPQCPKLATCAKTTAAASSDDLAWHASIFTGQPWALMVVWGRSPRAEPVWQAYGLAGATLVPRPIRVLEE